jgi:hypothetical protein
MIIDVATMAEAELDLSEWSAAEILDTSLGDESLLRATVYRLGAGEWQWSISSLDGNRGELISTGIERNAAAARKMATSEIAKCLESALD